MPGLCQNLSRTVPFNINPDSSDLSPSSVSSGSKAYGLDISHYQGNILSNLQPADSVTFVFIKAPISTEDFQSGVKIWLDSVESATDMTPIIYASPYFVDEYLSDTTMSRYSLWVADWTDASEPELPDIWKSAGWNFWQESSSKIIEGTTVDWDIFKGNKFQLSSFIQKSHHHTE